MLFSFSASPPPAVPPTMLSSRGCGYKGPSEMYSRVHPEVERVSSTPLPSLGEESLHWWMDEGGFLFFIFIFFVVLVQGFHRCIKRCTSYLHSLGLVTETNKK